jgi:hypothetical protein
MWCFEPLIHESLQRRKISAQRFTLQRWNDLACEKSKKAPEGAARTELGMDKLTMKT